MTDFLQYLQANLIREGVYHFSAREICPAGKKAGDAELQPAHAALWPNAFLTLHRLEWLRAQLREAYREPVVLRIHSGYRDRRYNAAVGGEGGSLHTVFNAFDFSAWAKRAGGIWEPVGDPEAWARLLEGLPDAKRFGIGIYKTFVHLDTRGYLGYSGSRWRG